MCPSIVIGAVQGHFSEVFGKIAKLHAKTSFSLAIVTGDLFADPENSSEEHEAALASLLDGKVTICMPTYFSLGKHPLPQQIIERLESSSDEVCENLYFLGKRSTTKTSESIRIVTLGGSLDPGVTAGLSKDKYLPFHTQGDANALHGANGADILITNTWPASIRSGSKIQFPEDSDEAPSEECIGDLCSALKPRYHFTSSPQLFYEREPFFHLTEDNQPDTTSITRFISMAAFDNTSKQKWLYAFTFDPNATLAASMPSGTTITPIPTGPRKRQRDLDGEQAYSRYGHHNGDYYRPKKRLRQAPPTPRECFFCLSNPKLNTNVICSIGIEAYLTVAKGPLSTLSTFPSIDFPAHILIIPLPHVPTITSITPAETKVSTYKEMQRYRQSLHSMLNARSKGALGSVTWEISRREGVHDHWQFLPVPVDLINKGLVEVAFKVQAENEKYPTFKTKDIGDGTTEKTDFFRVWIWQPASRKGDEKSDDESDDEDENQTEGKEKSLILPLDDVLRFDLQFGRRVMAKLLGLETRMNWRDCEQSEDGEKEYSEKFKAAFKPFDFSLVED